MPETDTVFFNVDDVWQDHHSLPDSISVTLGKHLAVDSRRIVLFNSLSWSRKEVVYLQVSTPYVKVTKNSQILICLCCQALNHVVSFQVIDSSGNVIQSQSSPIFQYGSISESSVEVAFVADLKPLSITTYTISLSEPQDTFG